MVLAICRQLPVSVQGRQLTYLSSAKGHFLPVAVETRGYDDQHGQIMLVFVVQLFGRFFILFVEHVLEIRHVDELLLSSFDQLKDVLQLKKERRGAGGGGGGGGKTKKKKKKKRINDYQRSRQFTRERLHTLHTHAAPIKSVNMVLNVHRNHKAY